MATYVLVCSTFAICSSAFSVIDQLLRGAFLISNFSSDRTMFRIMHIDHKRLIVSELCGLKVG